MVVCQGNDHDGSDDDLAIYNNRLLLDRVHTEDSGLGKVDTVVSSVSVRSLLTHIGVP